MQAVVTGSSKAAIVPTRPSRRILVLGQAVHPTGYARVLHSIAERLKDQFDITHFGINYRGEPLNCGWQIRPNQLVGDILGRKALPSLLDALQPHLVFICHDASLYKVHQPALDNYKAHHALKVVFYCPVEWPFIIPGAATSLATLDQLVLYTNYGLHEVQAALHKAPQASENVALPPHTVIPHGVDTERFYPICGSSTAARQMSRRLARRILFPNRPELDSGFIVLNANRNCRRKRVDITLRAFAEFAAQRTDVWLYLHMGMRDHGVDVLSLARELGIADRVLTTSTTPEKPEVSDQQLNLIYNACDVGLNTATGEGWGLVAFEHAATGAAQIVPDHSACVELWRGRGLLAPLTESAADPTMPTEWGTVSVSGVAALLRQLYENRPMLSQYQQLAYTYATSPQFSWGNIAQRWAQLFNQLISSAA